MLMWTPLCIHHWYLCWVTVSFYFFVNIIFISSSIFHIVCRHYLKTIYFRVCWPAGEVYAWNVPRVSMFKICSWQICSVSWWCYCSSCWTFLRFQCVLKGKPVSCDSEFSMGNFLSINVFAINTIIALNICFQTYEFCVRIPKET